MEDLRKVLEQQGVEVIVAAPKPASFSSDTEQVYWLPRWVPLKAKGFHRFGLEASLKKDPLLPVLLPPFLLAFTLEAAILALQADCVLAHWLFPMGVVAWAIHRLTSKPYGIVAHSGPPPIARILPVSRLARAVVRDAVKVAAVSQSVLREFSKLCDGPKAEFLPLGIDLRPSVRRPESSHGGPLQVLFVGRLIRLKGVDVLLEALQGIEGVECAVVGDGPERRALEGIAPSVVRFLGECNRERVRAMMSAFDVLVIPSRKGAFGREEGLPRVLLEAWSCGLPVVASATGGLKEMVQSYGGGILFEPEDVPSLRKTLLSLRDNRAVLNTLSKEATKASSLFCWQRLGPKWFAFVEGLAQPQ